MRHPGDSADQVDSDRCRDRADGTAKAAAQKMETR
jgi:hypothetical protein